MHGLERGERHRRHLAAVLEEDVAVEVHRVGRRGPFVGAERRELARVVRRVRHRDVLLPDRLRDRGRHQRGNGLAPADEVVDGVERDPRHLLLALRLEDERLRLGELADRRAGNVRLLDDADVLGVVGHAGPVERRVDLDLVPERVLDRKALEVLVRVGRRVGDVADRPRVEGPARVDVRLAEVRVPVGVGLGGRRRGHEKSRDGEAHRRDRGPAAHRDSFFDGGSRRESDHPAGGSVNAAGAEPLGSEP